MLLRSITAPLTAIRGIGPALIPKLARLGIHDVAGLLCHYPRDWEDRSVTVPIGEFQRRQVCTEVTVIARDWIGFGRMRRLKPTLKVYVEDESGRAALLCFNRPWLDKQLVQGGRFRLWGRFYYKYGEIQSSSFEIEPSSSTNSADSGRILPVYPPAPGCHRQCSAVLPTAPLSNTPINWTTSFRRKLSTGTNSSPKPPQSGLFIFPPPPQSLNARKKR